MEFVGGEGFITADHADNILIESLVLDGGYQMLGAGDGLIDVRNSAGVRLVQSIQEV